MTDHDEAVIYALLDPRTEKVRYVGKTTNIAVRYRRHSTERGQTHRHNWLEQLRREGLRPELQILEYTTKSRWRERERWWIAFYREKGVRLTNIADGGNGASGISPSKETRRRISESVKRAWQENPRTLSEKHKAALFAANKGRKRSVEWCHKISEALKGRRLSAERVQQMSDYMRGRKRGPPSAETRAKISVAVRGERNGMAKLTMQKAEEIRRRYAVGGISLSALGREYGVDTKRIRLIVRNEAWIPA